MTDLDVRLDVVMAMRNALASHVDHPGARQRAAAALRTLDVVLTEDELRAAREPRRLQD